MTNITSNKLTLHGIVIPFDRLARHGNQALIKHPRIEIMPSSHNCLRLVRVGNSKLSKREGRTSGKEEERKRREMESFFRKKKGMVLINV